MRYKATVSYDGTDYAGWQKQPDQITVQGLIEKALFNLTKEHIETTGAGRTDAGVHAHGQVFHFDCDKEFTDIARAINSQLPEDIHIMECEKVNDDFHARYDARWKYYCYKVNTGEYDPIDRNHIYQLCRDLDIDIMDQGAQLFVGKHDFTSFNATRKSEIENQVRTIYSFDVYVMDDIVYFDIIGDGFLRHMVRMLVGALISLGLGKITLEDLCQQLEKADKTASSVNIPACGLYLEKISYEEWLQLTDLCYNS